MRPVVVLVCAVGVLLSGVVGAAADESVVTIGRAGVSPTLVLDAAGNPVIAYHDEKNADLLVVHCNDPDCSGGDDVPVAVDSEGDTGFDPTLVLDASGYPVIAYRDRTDADLRLVHCNDLACAGGDDVPAIVDSVGDTGADPTLVLDAAGHPVIAYHDVTNGALRLVRCGDPDCVGGDDVPVTVETSVENNGVTGLGPSMMLDAVGNPVVVYNDSFERAGEDLGDLRLVHCNDPGCSGGDDTPVVVKSFVRPVVVSASLALDASGNPVVSYVNWWGDTVELLHCNDPACAGDDDMPVVIRRFIDVGSSTSMVLDQSGKPVVAYDWDYRQDFSRLSVARCADPNCVTSAIESPDFPTNLGDQIGLQPSLVLDASGHPVIAYYAFAPNRQLRLLHCNDPHCADDMVAPVATIDLAEGQAAVTSHGVVSFSVVFNEPVVGFEAIDVIVSGSAGATLATVSGSGPAYTVTVEAISGNGTVTIEVPAGAATDIPGNESAASIVVVNTIIVDGLVVPTTSAPTPSGELPATGKHALSAVLAALLVIGGCALMRLSRRRFAH